jgi:serine/threonine-protein kinase
MKFISAMKAERAIAQLLAAPDVNSPAAQKALRSLMSSGTGAIPTLIDAFSSADRHQTAGIVEALAAQIKDSNFDVVIDGLRRANDRCIAGTAWALSSATNFNPNKLIPVLLEDDVSKHAVLDVMRAHADRLSMRDLLAIAYKIEAREKAAVFKIIGKKATEDFVPELLSRLGGRDHSARVHLVEILAKFERPDVIEALEEMLKDSNRLVRSAALVALGNMESAGNIELICSLLMDPDIEVQSKAVDVAIKMRHPETCKYLVPVLQDESEYTRRSAVEVLNELADSASIKYLLVAIGDGDWWVRSRACDALAKIGGPRVLQAVMQLISDKDENIRRSAIEILNQTKDEAAVEHLIAATRDEDWWVCERSVDALAAIGNTEAVPRLVEMIGENPKTVPSVMRALGQLGDTKVLPKIMPLLKRSEPEIVTAAIKAATKLTREQDHVQVGEQIKPLIGAGNPKIAQAAHDAIEELQDRFSDSAILAERKAAQLAEPAHTMLTEAPTAQHFETASAESAALDITKLAQGDVIEDRYEFVEKIGQGAFGTVILVKDMVVDEQLILKFLNSSVANDEEMLQRFVHELRFSRKITHRNVIRIYDFLNLSGSYAISMEYFPSHTLGSEVSGQPLPFEKAIGWANDIATGMSVAHQVGIIHRDLKPANVLINQEGLLKIVDFGVAAAAGAGDTQLTKTGYVIGSPKYMAPEQILGKKVDARSDIYSLGVIFYEMLTGTPPYTKGDHMAVMYQHVQGKCARCDEVNPTIPQELANIVHKAMAVDKLERYESMDDLRRALAGETQSTEPTA